MNFKKFSIILIFLGLADAIPMDFRKDVPADEILSFTQPAEEVESVAYRLPNDTRPIRYDVFLKTDVHNGGEAEFKGRVKIEIVVLQTTNEITIHQRLLTIERIDIFYSTNVLLQSDITYEENKEAEFLIIPTTTLLSSGNRYIIEITYRGLLRDDNLGFYRSSYKNPSNENVFIATTQFEQTDARHAFPCYDEPQIRAVFGISIEHDKSYNAISNWPMISSLPSTGNYVVTKFNDTEPVQSYLIAFVVSDFEFVENDAFKKQRVYAKPQSITNNEAALALDAGQKILDKYVEHFGIDYAPPKLDQVAVPDFDAGAMENWGLVTYREEYLLYNEELATTRQRENILTVITHEYAVS